MVSAYVVNESIERAAKTMRRYLVEYEWDHVTGNARFVYELPSGSVITRLEHQPRYWRKRGGQ